AALTPTEQGGVAASLASACLQGATFSLKTELGGANLTNAAIAATPNERGSIEVTHYDADHNLVGPEPILSVGSPPSPTSFTDGTVCPQGISYGSNPQQGLPFAQMMQSDLPPTTLAP